MSLEMISKNQVSASIEILFLANRKYIFGDNSFTNKLQTNLNKAQKTKTFHQFACYAQNFCFRRKFSLYYQTEKRFLGTGISYHQTVVKPEHISLEI